jgi:glycyl-tRNA synthetase alpha chain
MQNNVYNFEVASTEMLFQQFELFEAESKRVIEMVVNWDEERSILTTRSVPESVATPDITGPKALVYPALDLALKASHVFNLLDARGAIGVTQRADYINRIRARIRACCLKHIEQYKKPDESKKESSSLAS